MKFTFLLMCSCTCIRARDLSEPNWVQASTLPVLVSGFCRGNAPSTSCLDSAWCWCWSLCSGCSSAVQVTCLQRRPRTGVSRSSRRRRRAQRTFRCLQRTTPPGVLTNWSSWFPSENASRSCWCSFLSCTRSSTRRRFAIKSSSSTRWITTGEASNQRRRRRTIRTV